MIAIPASVPEHQHEVFKKNYSAITKNTERLFIFAVDQKMEHLNEDFSGSDLAPEINNPKHVFKIAKNSPIGAFASHVGLISRYAPEYPNLPYLTKLDGKTNLNKSEPYSQQLWSVKDALDLNINLHAVGYTIYLGSDYERDMLTEAAQIITDAHQHGLVTVLWIYPRGKNVPDQDDPNVIAGAAGMAASLGADFVKIRKPSGFTANLQQAVQAAGNTKVLVSGGIKQNPKDFLQEVYDNIHEGKTAGGAIGRNIFQLPQKQAIALSTALSRVIYQNIAVQEALDLYKSLY
jgi:DhnA family fructose-bisphosphate aldolase class Ia